MDSKTQIQSLFMTDLRLSKLLNQDYTQYNGLISMLLHKVLIRINDIIAYRQRGVRHVNILQDLAACVNTLKYQN